MEPDDVVSEPARPARLVRGDVDRSEKLQHGERLTRDLRAPQRRTQGDERFAPEDRPIATAGAIEALLDPVRGELSWA